jgi:hypothetical protein
MQSTSRITISGQVSGLTTGYKYIGPLTIANPTHAIGTIRDIASVSTTTATIVTVPTNAIGVLIAFGTQTNSTTKLRLWCTTNPGTLTNPGAIIGYNALCRYAIIPIGTGVTKLHLQATTYATTNLELTFF